MRENENRIAIYSRKSKFTGKGESIGNQVELCREYIRTHYADIQRFASVVENREEEPELDLTELIRDNAANLAKCREHGCEVILIDDEYRVELTN